MSIIRAAPLRRAIPETKSLALRSWRAGWFLDGVFFFVFFLGTNKNRCFFSVFFKEQTKNHGFLMFFKVSVENMIVWLRLLGNLMIVSGLGALFVWAWDGG